MEEFIKTKIDTFNYLNMKGCGSKMKKTKIKKQVKLCQLFIISVTKVNHFSI